jgi:hypothetical protein
MITAILESPWTLVASFSVFVVCACAIALALVWTSL